MKTTIKPTVVKTNQSMTMFILILQLTDIYLRTYRAFTS
jgi:hypothetical protein